MKEKSIIFSGEVVRAIRDGRKTMTRRVVKLEGDWSYDGQYDGDKAVLWSKEKRGTFTHLRCPYGKVGDHIWVREAFLDAEDYPCHPYHDDDEEDVTSRWDYKVDCPLGQQESIGWKSPIYMPREASRITLEITDLRVERLQKISDADAIKEGVDQTNTSINGYAKERFKRLWNKINGKKHPWASNPFVWVIEFKRI